MKATKIGGPFLNRKEKGRKDNNDRQPLITPLIQCSNTLGMRSSPQRDQQFLLIPGKNAIKVICMENGSLFSELQPMNDNVENSKTEIIYSIILVQIPTEKNIIYSKDEVAFSHNKSDDNYDTFHDVQIDKEKEWIVLAGCQNGKILEWTLHDIVNNQRKKKRSNCLVPVIYPRRIFSILPGKTQQDNNDSFVFGNVTHMTWTGSGTLLYSLVRGADESKDDIFLRITIPIFVKNDNSEDDTIGKVKILLWKAIKKFCTVGKVENNSRTRKELRRNKVILQEKTFLMLSCVETMVEAKLGKNSFVIFFHTNGFYVYYENFRDSLDADIEILNNNDDFVHFPCRYGSCGITAAAISPNGVDVSVAYENGKIDTYFSVLTHTAHYVRLHNNNHPSIMTLIQTAHWHPLPVRSLCYLRGSSSNISPNLLSGGEESVLVTWSIKSGFNHPFHTLPRISKGSISHIIAVPYTVSINIVVICIDNTIQLIEGHNHVIRWKIQGLASSKNEYVPIAGPFNDLTTMPPLIIIDPRTQLPLITRLQGSPGFVHWFDMKYNRVVKELEVASYNRISRKESDHYAYPRPMVTHLTISLSGRDMITVDTMITENINMGTPQNVNMGYDTCNMSLTSNIKFWLYSGKYQEVMKNELSMHYELVTSMASPHSRIYEVDDLSISPSGSKACTLSVKGEVFHLWGKEKTLMNGGNVTKQIPMINNPRSPLWKRLYIVSTPAGYTNSKRLTRGNGSLVSFSSDGSVLLVSYGQNITLWDHSNATMLNTIRAPEIISHIQFLPNIIDSILAVGKSSILLFSPFDSGSLGSEIWSYKLPNVESTFSNDTLVVSSAIPLLSSKEICIAIKATKFKKKSPKSLIESTVTTSKVFFLNMSSGEPKRNLDDTPYSYEIDGTILSMCDVSVVNPESNNNLVSVLVLTDSHELYILEPEEKSFHILEQLVKI